MLKAKTTGVPMVIGVLWGREEQVELQVTS